MEIKLSLRHHLTKNLEWRPSGLATFQGVKKLWPPGRTVGDINFLFHDFGLGIAERFPIARTLCLRQNRRRIADSEIRRLAAPAVEREGHFSPGVRMYAV